MYQANTLFRQPDNEDIKVWRYMDFTKFISLIDKRKLHFARADKFDDDDPFEGSWPKKSHELRNKLFAGISEEGQKMSNEEVSRMVKSFKLYNFISCWHANEFESAAMWKLYLKSDKGIAIQSTYSRLKKCIIDDESVFLGKVSYINYETDSINIFEPVAPFVHKRKSFDYEQEIRAIVLKIPPNVSPSSNLGFVNPDKEPIKDGLLIAVDIEILIQKVYVAPDTPLWFYELVNSTIKKFVYDFDVEQSQMDRSPFF